MESNCNGVAISQERCVGHIASEDLSDYIAQLGPDAVLDARGAVIDGQRCQQLMELIEDTRFGMANFREARFTDRIDMGGAQFSSAADFRGAQFASEAHFSRTQFGSAADFREAHFAGGVYFNGAKLGGRAYFDRAHFGGQADFREMRITGGVGFTRAQFTSSAIFREVEFTDFVDFNNAQFDGRADFRETQFGGRSIFFKAHYVGDAHFGGAKFANNAAFYKARFTSSAVFRRVEFGAVADFREAQFSSWADFREAQFRRLCLLGPLRADALGLHETVFEGPTTIHGECSTIMAENIRTRDAFTLTGRGCDITMTGGRFDAPARIGSSPDTISFPPSTAADEHDKPPRLLSVEGTDVANLTIAGVDLGACLFIGAYNVDRLHIDGPPDFAETPASWRWTRRRTLAEEHLWRASYYRRPAGWYPPRCRETWPGSEPVHDPHGARTMAAGAEAARVQAAYRELRKSFEDARNEPGAADFYYGEMEMRRMASRAAPAHRFENALLTAYWALSGYGLRASRAILALLLALALATVLFATVGFGRSQQTVYVPIGNTAANQPVAYKQTSVPDGKPGSLEAAYYSVQSATSLLREPTTEPLTTVGRITEITLRLLGPLLLGLAVL